MWWCGRFIPSRSLDCVCLHSTLSLPQTAPFPYLAPLLRVESSKYRPKVLYCSGIAPNIDPATQQVGRDPTDNCLLEANDLTGGRALFDYSVCWTADLGRKSVLASQHAALQQPGIRTFLCLSFGRDGMAHDLSNLCQRPPSYCPAVFFAQRSSSTDMRDATMSQRFLLHQQNGHVRAKGSLPRASRQGETLPDDFPSSPRYAWQDLRSAQE